MNSKNKMPLREIIFLTAGEIVTSAIIVLVYLLIGKLDYTVVTGAALGSLVTVMNFLFLSITVNRAVDKILAERDFTPAEALPPDDEAIQSAASDDDETPSSTESDDEDSDEDKDEDSAAKFAKKYEKKLQASVKLSYVVRTVTMIGALVAALLTKQFNVIATVIPLFMLRPLLTISEMTKRKEK